MWLKFMFFRKILVLKLRGIGDSIIATPTVSNLKIRCPDAFIGIVVYPQSYYVFKNNPYINKIYIYNKGWRNYLKLVKNLRKQKFDLAINLNASFRSALISYLSGAPHRIVNNHSGKNYFANFGSPPPRIRKSVIERDLDCLRVLGIEPKDKKTRFFLSDRSREQACLFPTNKTVSISPGGSCQAKRWLPERFGELADRLVDDGTEVILLCGPDEEGIVKEVTKKMKHRPTIKRPETVKELGRYIKFSNLVVGNSSAVVHLATAVGVKNLTLFGSENPKEWHPYTEKDKSYMIAKAVDCRGEGCGKLFCEDHRCMKLIEVDEVYKKVKRILK